MDLSLSEEEQLIKNTARDFLEKECPTSLVRLMEKDERGFPSDLWAKMAKMGWLGLPFEEQYGGAGARLISLAVLLEELGRACDPTPYLSTVVAAGLTLQEAGSDSQKTDILPRIARGSMLLSPAIVEESGSYSASDVNTSAKRSGNAFTISGRKMFVENAHIADLLLVAVRTTDTSDKQDGISLLLIDRDTPGVSMRQLDTLARDKQYEVLFNDVSVTGDRLVGDLNRGWPAIERAIKRTAILQCAEQVGGARKVLDMTVEYIGMRVQFGRPIGSFQAAQHHAANMWMVLESGWLATYEAIWRLSEGLPADEAIAIANAWVGDTHPRMCMLAHHLHGGIGYMEEYDLQLWTRRAKAMEMKWGSPSFYRKQLATVL